MADDQITDHYEELQISVNADPDTVNRVYRLMAQRFHPDNPDTGDANRFRRIHDAHSVLCDPEKRAKYDAVHERQRQERWRFISAGAAAENDFEMEHSLRLTVLEVLYTRRRVQPQSPGFFPVEIELLTARPREHLEFTIWFLVQKGLLQRTDTSRVVITAEGVEYLEQNYRASLQQRLRLRAASEPVTPAT
jgi:curved DNA-binding protein CbpA